MDFLRRRANDLLSYPVVDALTLPSLKRFFDSPIFAGMKGQNCDAAAGLQTAREKPQEHLQSSELLVHGNSKRLKDTSQSTAAIGPLPLAWQGLQRKLYDAGEFGGSCQRFDRVRPDDGVGKQSCMGLVRILLKHLLEVLLVQTGEPSGGWLPFLWVHSQIERPLEFIGKPPGGIIELHGGAAEIRENHVCPIDFHGGEHARQSCEIGMHHLQDFRAESEPAEALFGFGQFNGIRVEPNQSAAGADRL